MEASRSFASLFPISQSQIILPRTQQALWKQEQMRKKEVHLQNQLHQICQRQRDAHRRNKDLLRDFKRIEQKLSLLTAKSDSFRRKQEKYKKQNYLIMPEKSKCATPNSTTRSMDDTYIKQFNDFPAANHGNLANPCHFTASIGHVVQPLTHFSVYPNQQQGPQGCCNPSLCCGLLHPKNYGHLGSYMADLPKILDSTLDCQSQKTKCPSDSSIHRNYMFVHNPKRDIIQHCPEYVWDKDTSQKWNVTPTHVHGDPLQCILTSDLHGDWKEKLLQEAQQQIVKQHSVQTTVQSKEDSSKRHTCFAGSPNSDSVHQNTPMDSSSKSHLSSLSLPARDHNGKDRLNPVHNVHKRKKTKQPKSKRESSPFEVTAEEQIEGALCKQQAKIDSHEMNLRLKLNKDPDIIGIDVNEPTINSKNENRDIDKDECEQEMKQIDLSKVENICEGAVGHPNQKNISSTSFLNQHEKEKGFLSTLLKRSLEDFVNSNDEENKVLKGSKMCQVTKENENSNRCRASEDEHGQGESSFSSGLSMVENRSTDRSSAKEKIIKEGQEMVQHNQILGGGKQFSINEDKIKGIMGLHMSEQESEPSESQMQENKCDDRNKGMAKQNGKFNSQSLLENNKTKDIYEVMNNDKFREILSEEIEKSSSNEDTTGDEMSETEGSVYEKVCIFTVKEKDTQEIVNINEERNNEDTGMDRASEEDEISVNNSQGSCIVIGNTINHEITDEEPSSIEDDEENKFTNEIGNQTIVNTENIITSEEEMSDKVDTSEEDRLSSDVLDEINEVENSEEEENTDFWGSRHEENDSDIEEMCKDEQLQSLSTQNSTKQEIAHVSARGDDPHESAALLLDMPAPSCHQLIEDEELNSEKKRSSWLCCLKTCPLPKMLNKSGEHQPDGKRCSEDGSMDMLQLHPVEFGSSLPAEVTSAGSIAKVQTEVASVAETVPEDSDEESLHSKKESEHHNPSWSDSEDNVDSFYD